MGGEPGGFRPANDRFPARPQPGMGRQVSIMQIGAEQDMPGDPPACQHHPPRHAADQTGAVPGHADGHGIDGPSGSLRPCQDRGRLQIGSGQRRAGIRDPAEQVGQQARRQAEHRQSGNAQRQHRFQPEQPAAQPAEGTGPVHAATFTSPSPAMLSRRRSTSAVITSSGEA